MEISKRELESMFHQLFRLSISHMRQYECMNFKNNIDYLLSEIFSGQEEPKEPKESEISKKYKQLEFIIDQRMKIEGCDNMEYFSFSHGDCSDDILSVKKEKAETFLSEVKKDLDDKIRLINEEIQRMLSESKTNN